MKNICAILVIFMVLTTFAGCQNSELKQSITTEYGDHLKIHAYLSGNLHKRYFTCKIYCDGTESFAYFYNPKIQTVPSDLGADLYSVVKTNNTRVYKLFDEFIVIYNDLIDNFPSTYNLEDFIYGQNQSDSVNAVIYNGIKALCQMRRFEYIKQFSSILLYGDDDADISIIKLWALGEFSKEELAINQDYSKEEITKWCIDFLSHYNK